jgi:FkbM family methyltransferase
MGRLMGVVVDFKHGAIAYRFHHAAAGGLIWGAHDAGRFYEQDLLEAIAARGRRGVYVDVGASIGNHARFFAEECPAELVVAIEAAPIAQALLAKNLKGASVPVRIVECFATDDPDHRWRLQRGVLQRDDQGTCGIPIDTLLRDEKRRVAVIKIDVEGHEPNVLRGAAKRLVADKPLLAIEAWNQDAVLDQLAVLAPLGYRREPRRYCATPTYLWSCP